MQDAILILAKNIANVARAEHAAGHGASYINAVIASVIKCGMNGIHCPLDYNHLDHWTNLHAAAQQVARAEDNLFSFARG